MITIDEEKFDDILAKTTVEFAKDGVDIGILTAFCVAIKLRLNVCKKSFETKNYAPFNVGDTVFVIDNDGDHNNVVNQIVTVTRVDCDRECCTVENNKMLQVVDFKNLRKVKTP